MAWPYPFHRRCSKRRALTPGVKRYKRGTEVATAALESSGSWAIAMQAYERGKLAANSRGVVSSRLVWWSMRVVSNVKGTRPEGA
eukprot:3415658-Amphidinium_carterae.1